jgi:two-component system OmpR family sensor kinase
VVLAVACVGIGAVTEFALYRYLVGQLDTQLQDASHRSVRIFGEPPSAPWRHHPRAFPRPGPGPVFLDAPGQPVGMVGAVIDHRGAVEAGYLTTAGGRAELTDDAKAQLVKIPVNRAPVTRDINGLGRYRMIAAPERRSGDVIITGLSLSEVDATIIRVMLIFAVVIVIALAAATTAGIIIIRRALAPLRRVAQTASEVVDLPLDRGEVALPVRVLEADANPRTEVGQLGSAVNRMLDHIATALSTRQASETRVRQFVADASHELRTPLSAIRGYTELAQRMRDDNEAVAHAMKRVQSETERMTHLVEDLLLLARLTRGDHWNANRWICPGWPSTRSAMRTSPGRITSGSSICPKSR